MLNIYKLIIFILLLLITKKCKEKFTNQDKYKNILIIGATSKIGQVILKNDNKHNYFLLSRDKKNLENLQKNRSNKIKSTILTIDFSDKRNIDLVISNFKPPIFWKDKEVVKQQVQNWSYENVEKLIYEINEIELLIKKYSNNSINILSNFIIDQSNKISN